MQLINNILDISKIEADTCDIEIVDFYLLDAIKSFEPLMKAKAVENGIEFKVVAGGKLPTLIHTDPTRLKQCLVNLTNNAIKFTEKGHVHVHLSVQENDKKSVIRFDVEDTGIGIPAGKHATLFEPFTQVDGGITRKYGGTGLGLTIAKRLATLLGGGHQLYK